jgi:very-long-chain (3R)-3-hydroxyacyl-CoA dehydratase
MSSKASSAKKEKTEEEKTGMNAYLVLYNVGCAVGWSIVLFYCIKNIALGSINKIWDESEVYLKVVQTIAVMEILHAYLKVVRSNPFTTFLQVFSRVWTLWGIHSDNLIRAAY